LDIALGLVNAYVKRSIKKGLVKVSQAPARRYAYYLTPQGFSEKSRGRARRRPWSLQRLSQARNQKRTCKARASASPEVCLLSHSSGLFREVPVDDRISVFHVFTLSQKPRRNVAEYSSRLARWVFSAWLLRAKFAYVFYREDGFVAAQLISDFFSLSLSSLGEEDALSSPPSIKSSTWMQVRLSYTMWCRDLWNSPSFRRSGMIQVCSINRIVGTFEIRLDRLEFSSMRTQSTTPSAN